jgi:hypothetical protein
MLIALAVLLLVAWIFGFVVFHVTIFVIHILLILAIIAFAIHFLRPRRT